MSFTSHCKTSDQITLQKSKGPLAYLPAPPSSAELQYQMGIFQQANSAKIRATLSENYPRLKRILGEDLFIELTQHYIKEKPSQYRKYDEISMDLPSFLKQTFPWKQQVYLGDLAEFEWASFKAKLSLSLLPPIENNTTRQNSKKSAPANHHARIHLHPSVQLLKTQWPVHLNLSTTDYIQRGPHPHSYVLFKKKSSEISALLLSDLQWQLLQLIQRGIPFHDLARNIQALNISIEKTMIWFKNWAQNGIIEIHNLHKN